MDYEILRVLPDTAVRLFVSKHTTLVCKQNYLLDPFGSATNSFSVTAYHPGAMQTDRQHIYSLVIKAEDSKHTRRHQTADIAVRLTANPGPT